MAATKNGQKSASKEKPYSGLLAEPRKPPAPLSMLDDAKQELAERQRQDADDFLLRLGLLLDHYAIRRDEPNALVQLLLALLVAHVPGFRTARGRGAATFWTPQRQVELVFDVQRAIDGGKVNSAAAAFRDRTLQQRYEQGSAESLRRRYEEAKGSPIVIALEKLGAGRLSLSGMAELFHSNGTT